MEIIRNHMVTYSADPFRAVADPTRRAVLEYLLGKPHNVNELADHFDVSRPAISKHLRVLLDAGLVSESRDGRNRMYQLKPGPLREVDRWIEQYRGLWAVNLQNLKSHVEAKVRKPQ